MPAEEWLSRVAEPIRNRLRADSVRMTYADGQLVHARGEQKPGLSIIHSGRIRFGTTGANGSFIQFSVLNRGDVFGEMTVFTGVGRWHDAFAVGPVVVDQLSRDRFLAIIHEFPELAIHMLELLAWRLHYAFEGVDDIMRRPLVERIGRYLIHASGTVDAGKMIELRQSELGEAMGASRVSINKALRELADLGFLVTGYGKVELRNRDALQAWLSGRDQVVQLIPLSSGQN
ncbi:MAG: Crp/Fnr family transcriptional regulator [Sphingomonadaceae bacterium]